jgi:aspartyl protease family protein
VVDAVGYVKVKGFVANPFDRDKCLELEFLADTGAMYTSLPESTLKKLEIVPMGKRSFLIASGERKEFPVGEAYIEVEGIGVTSLVLYGSEGVPSLLGVTTLELLGLQVDPTTGKLKPAELYLL